MVHGGGCGSEGQFKLVTLGQHPTCVVTACISNLRLYHLNSKRVSLPKKSLDFWLVP